jgi:hypothetical protein
MPTTADNSPNILWPLPEGVPAFVKSEIFSTEMLQEIKNSISKHANWGPEADKNLPNYSYYHTIVGRWVTEIPLSDSIKEYVENLGRSSWGRESIELKSIWFARYQQHKGVTPYLWEHMDQPGTQYTMDICIESPGVSWEIVVDGETFSEKENSALFFMGQQQSHSRPPYPVDDKDAYVVVMFALFVDDSHWMAPINIEDPTQEADWEILMDRYKLDGDIRYYEYSGHAPRFDGLPAGNYECMDGQCNQCNVVDEDFITKIPGYKSVNQ